MAKGSMSKPPPVPVEEDGSRLSKELTPFIQQPPPYKPKSLSSSTTTEVDKGSSGSGGRCRAVKQTPSLFHQLSLSQHFTHVTIDPISSSSSSETMVGVVQPTGPDNANLSSEAHTPRCKPQQSISQQQQQQQQLDEMQHFPPSPPSHSPANASKVQVTPTPGKSESAPFDDPSAGGQYCTSASASTVSSSSLSLSNSAPLGRRPLPPTPPPTQSMTTSVPPVIPPTPSSTQPPASFANKMLGYLFQRKPSLLMRKQQQQKPITPIWNNQESQQPPSTLIPTTTAASAAAVFPPLSTTTAATLLESHHPPPLEVNVMPGPPKEEEEFVIIDSKSNSITTANASAPSFVSSSSSMNALLTSSSSDGTANPQPSLTSFMPFTATTTTPPLSISSSSFMEDPDILNVMNMFAVTAPSSKEVNNTTTTTAAATISKTDLQQPALVLPLISSSQGVDSSSIMTPNSSTPTAKPIPIIVTSSSTESSDGSDSSSSNSQLLLPDSSSPLFKKLSPSSDISIISTSPNSKLASTLTSPAKLNAIEQPIWVPAHLHPELHPNDFKKWVSTHWQDSTEDNYGYRFSDGKLAFVNHLKNKKPALKRTSSFADRHMVVTADNVGEWVQSQQDSPSTLSDLAAISAATTVEYTKDQHACSSPPNYMMAKRSPSSSSTTSTSSNGGGLNNALQAPLRRSRNIRGRKSSTLSSSLESGGNGDRHHRKSLGPISRKSSDGGAGSGGVTVATSLPTVASTSASTSTSVGVVGVGRGRRPTLKLGLPNYPDHATVNKTSYAAVAAAGAAADDIMRDITIPISPSLGDEAVVVDDELMPQQYRNEVVIDGTEAKRVSSSSAVLIKRPSTSSSSPSSSSAAAIETPRMAKAFSYENTPVSPTNSRRQQQDVPVLLNSSDRILHADDEDEEMTGGSVTMEENRLAKSLVEIEEVVATTAITTSPIEIESIETPVSVVAAAAETAATSKVVVQPPTSTTTTTTTPSVADVNEGTDGSSESSSSEDEEDIDLQGGKKAAKRGKKRDGKNASLETSLPTAAGGKKKGWSWFVGLFDSNSSKTEGDEAFQQLSVNATTTSAAAACAASSSTSLTKSASLSDGRPISSYDDDFEEGMAYPPDTLEVGPGRLPLNLEKAVYKASHEKLAQIRRPLHHQVMISNLMLYIISVHADVTLNRNGPRGLRKGGRRGRRRKSMGGGGVGGGGGSSSMKAMHRNHGLMTAGGGGGTRGYGEFPMDRAMLMNGAAVVSASTVLAANPSSPAAGYHNSMRPASPPGSHQRLPAPHLAAPLAFQSTTSLPHHSLMSAQLGAASTTSSSLMASQTSTTPPFSAYLHQQQQHQYQQHSQQSSSSFYMQQQEKTASSVSLPILNSASINKPHAEDDDDEVPLGVLQMSKRGSIVSI